MTDTTTLKSNPRFADALDLIRTYCQRLIDATGVPGFAIAITDRNETLATLEIGLANVDAGTPITPATLFETGSIDKAVTATLFMQLVDERDVDLHAPVSDYLPWFEVGGDRPSITAHHLLAHTAGIFSGMDHAPDARSETWSLRYTIPPVDPGETFAYSNLGYKALGLVLEHVTGWSYQVLVRERIFEPLGIRSSYPAITNAIRPELAVGYVPRYDDRLWRPAHGYVPGTWLETNSADGCFAMTTSDLATWLRCLLNEGAGPDGQVLTKAQFDRMIDAGSGEDEEWYAYGIERTRGDDRNLIGHDGDMIGYVSEMRGDLATGVGVVVFCNATLPYLATPVAVYAQDLLRAVVRKEELPAEPPIAIGGVIPDSERYLGTYGTGSDQLAITADGEGLVAELDDRRVALIWVPMSDDPDWLMVDDVELSRFPLQFSRDESDEIVECWLGERWFPGGRYDGPTTFNISEAWERYPGHYRSNDPWEPGFRVLLRKGQLWKVEYLGAERLLVPEGDGFRVGAPDSPAWLRFGDIADGKALRVAYENGAEFHRFFTP